MWLAREQQATNDEARAYLLNFIDQAVEREKDLILVDALQGKEHIAIDGGWNLRATLVEMELTAEDVFPSNDQQDHSKRRGTVSAYFADTGSRARQAPAPDGKASRHKVNVRGVGGDELDYTKMSKTRRAEAWKGVRRIDPTGEQIATPRTVPASEVREARHVLPFEGATPKKKEKKPAAVKPEGPLVAQPMGDRESRGKKVA
jgi:hypothetical protein